MTSCLLPSGCSSNSNILSISISFQFFFFFFHRDGEIELLALHKQNTNQCGSLALLMYWGV